MGAARAAPATQGNHSVALSMKRSAPSVTPKALTRTSSYRTYPMGTILRSSLDTSPMRCLPPTDHDPASGSNRFKIDRLAAEADVPCAAATALAMPATCLRSSWSAAPFEVAQPALSTKWPGQFPSRLAPFAGDQCIGFAHRMGGTP